MLIDLLTNKIEIIISNPYLIQNPQSVKPKNFSKEKQALQYFWPAYNSVFPLRFGTSPHSACGKLVFPQKTGHKIWIFAKEKQMYKQAKDYPHEFKIQAIKRYLEN
ncbi:hypothetical protein, partial [Leptospira soteropolitanensis]